jgi:hypothetical protein
LPGIMCRGAAYILGADDSLAFGCTFLAFLLVLLVLSLKCGSL